MGSKVDWMSQHTVFPDYFRKLFYETGNLFPNFAANIGAGQNIFNFSYYGFLSPVILISYLLPQVPMTVYIMATSLISLAAGCLLLYRWLRNKGFSEHICIVSSYIVLLAAPMFYHTYKQIMFVNYFPFLCLALIGVDRYFESKKKGLLTISIFLMIMSSFYFSVSGIFAIILYGASVYLGKIEKVTWKDFAVNGIKFLIPVITAVLMSCILLIPTFASLLESHRDGHTAIALYSLFIPEFKLLRYVYYPYGLGLPSIVITILLAGLFYKKREERVLSYGVVLISVFPFFLFLLNGGLYIGDKALIPFLPIIAYLIALFFTKLAENENQLQRKSLILFVITIVLALFGIGQTVYWFIPFIDALLMLLCYLVYLKGKRIHTLIIPVIAMLLVTNVVIQDPGKLVDKAIYQQVYDPNIKSVMQEAGKADPAFYRMDSLINKDFNFNRIYTSNQYLTSFYSSSYQKDYFDFRNKVFHLEQPYRNYLMQSASQNPLFLTFMGVKYVISEDAPVGYELYTRKGNVKLYRNEDVFPLGYVAAKLIPEKELDKAGFPYRQELLLNRTVISRPPVKQEAFHTKIRPMILKMPVLKTKDISITSDHDVYRVKALQDTYLNIDLPQPAKSDQVIFLKMKIKNLTPLQDISISIQNEQNKLSAKDHVYYNANTVFHYAVSVKKGSNVLNVKFSTGEYEISSLKSYQMNAADMINKNITESPFKVSAEDSKGDVISGFVRAAVDGYFVTTIPYDKGFEVTIDGNPVSYEKVNTAFIGFPITTGPHHIIFRYKSPGFLPGAAGSIIGILLFGLILYRDKKLMKLPLKGKL
jgi:Predicted membrane protein